MCAALLPRAARGLDTVTVGPSSGTVTVCASRAAMVWMLNFRAQCNHCGRFYKDPIPNRSAFKKTGCMWLQAGDDYNCWCAYCLMTQDCHGLNVSIIGGIKVSCHDLVSDSEIIIIKLKHFGLFDSRRIPVCKRKTQCHGPIQPWKPSAFAIWTWSPIRGQTLMTCQGPGGSLNLKHPQAARLRLHPQVMRRRKPRTNWTRSSKCWLT